MMTREQVITEDFKRKHKIVKENDRKGKKPNRPRTSNVRIR